METNQPHQYDFLRLIQFGDIDNWSTLSILGGKLKFNDRFPLAKIGSFLFRNKTEVKIKDNILYKRPTIRLYNGGIVLRDEVFGNVIGTKSQFRIKTGQFLLSKIDALNGAFGVVPEICDGCIITGNFWTFDVDYKKILPQYLDLVTASIRFRQFCQSASVGTTGRKYLQENLFLDIAIPLPDTPVQDELIKEYRDALDKILEAEKQKKKAMFDFEKELFN